MNLHVFCDFDGTATEEDVLVMVLRAFAPPPWEGIYRAILERRITLRQGVGDLFALLPSRLAPEMVAFALQHTRLRPGFGRLVETARTRGWELDVVSGGLDVFVDPLMAPYLPPEHRYRNHLNLSGPFMSVTWPVDCVCGAGCALCKPAILRCAPPARKVLIGDGLSDLPAAREADTVLAMGHLARYLEEEGRPCLPVRDFHEAVERLLQLEQEEMRG